MLALIDCRAPSSVISELETRGFTVISMPPASYLQTGVASHTDMLLFIGFGQLFCHATYYSSNKALIDMIASEASLSLCISSEPPGKNYPYDVLFNACLIGKKLICNKKTVSKLLLDAARADRCEIIHVSQGYTKCTVCTVSDSAIITSDRAISNTCREFGIDVLTVTDGQILLPPYEFGFIGGASGVCGKTVYFCGDIDSHPDADAIKHFCHKHERSVVALSRDSLLDVGTIIFTGE